jgi:hypothetical protein
MEPGTEETWAVELVAVEDLVNASAKAFEIDGPIHLHGQVGLGSGKTVTAPQRLRMR